MSARFTQVSAILLLSLAASASSRAGVVINEVLANEPSDSVTLEWFELFNDSDNPADLSFFSVQVGVTQLMLTYTLPAGEYLVVCRDSVGFVQRWGSDDSISYAVIEHSFTLTNDSGSVQLLQLGNPESELSWVESGADGVSWERVSPELALIKQSLDGSGSTPGRLNSVTPLPVDLALDSVGVGSEYGRASLTFLIINRGQNLVTDGVLTLCHFNCDQPQNRGEVITTLSIPPVDTGFTMIMNVLVDLSGVYTRLVAYLADDDRPENNQLDFFAPGAAYSPLVLNEVLPNPQGALTTEWIEILNRSDSSYDISGWGIGDAVGLHLIGGVPLIVGPGEYVVLAQDALAFEQFYLFDGIVCQPLSWPVLNNSGDLVRLVDSYSIEADCFEYGTSFVDNHTWSRSVQTGTTDEWGRSVEPGGSPGADNLIRLEPDAGGLNVTVEPQIISPDGDGIDDEAIIRIEAPSANHYSLKIYDRHGRVVKMFEDDSPDLQDGFLYRWDGRTDSGNRLPVGMYILYIEAGSVESLKKTVVIAR